MQLRVLMLVGMIAVAAVFTREGVLAQGRPFSTALTGAEEVPGPADPDASALASLTLNQGRGEVCFDLSWEDIDGTVVAAHIHEAPVGVAGPIVVPLFTDTALPGTGSATACVADVSRDLIKDIRQNPEDYYVNMHSTVFPAGAVRGQLSD